MRTTLLLATLTGLLVGIGYLIGGPGTAGVFLFMALAFNLVMFWFSDKIALRMSRAQPLAEEEAPRLHQMVRELSHGAGIPMPRLYMIPQDQPNAFATGRSPKHSAVAVTRGITQLLSESELRGVIAHELAHIKNRDILTTSIAAAVGGGVWKGGNRDCLNYLEIAWRPSSGVSISWVSIPVCTAVGGNHTGPAKTIRRGEFVDPSRQGENLVVGANEIGFFHPIFSVHSGNNVNGKLRADGSGTVSARYVEGLCTYSIANLRLKRG